MQKDGLGILLFLSYLSGGVEKRRVMKVKLQEAVAALEMDMALTTRRGGEKRGS